MHKVKWHENLNIFIIGVPFVFDHFQLKMFLPKKKTATQK